MRFRRAFMLMAALCAAPGLAAAQEARQVELGYEITFAGFAGFRLDVTARFDGARYDVESTAFKEGMLKAVTMNYIGRNRAWGGFSTEGPQPAAGSLSVLVGDKTRTWLAQYGPGGSVSETHTPEWKPAPHQVIPDSDRVGSLDPLTAGLSVGFAGDQACDRTVPSNDGKRRVDIILRKVGVEPAAKTGIPGAIGDVLVCDLFTRRVSGEFAEAAKEAETERERPIRVWLAHLDNTPIRYPAKLEASTGFGTIRGKLLFFRERPLSSAESQAMRR